MKKKQQLDDLELGGTRIDSKEDVIFTVYFNVFIVTVTVKMMSFYCFFFS